MGFNIFNYISYIIKFYVYGIVAIEGGGELLRNRGLKFTIIYGQFGTCMSYTPVVPGVHSTKKKYQRIYRFKKKNKKK